MKKINPNKFKKNHSFNLENGFYNIYGSYVDAQDAIGYCHCSTHRGYLTKAQFKSHMCDSKNCPFFEKNNNHSYFNQKPKDKDLISSYKKLKAAFFEGKIDLQNINKTIR